ncbi:hypothetical protein CN316_09995 [Bacillus cereus]|nr:hypothetical protein CN316_09995 [Bacillus cereus]
MSKNYSIDRDKNGRYRHSFVFMRGSEVSIKLFDTEGLIKGIVTSIEQFYLVVDVEKEGLIYQVTVNLGEVEYIKHAEFPTVEDRSPKKDTDDVSTSFVFNIGEKIICTFRDGKRLKANLLSESAFYLYVRTEKGSHFTVMKNAVNYVRHMKHEPGFLVNDFYSTEMKDRGYSKPTEFTFSVGDTITVVFRNGKELSGVVLDEEKYWILLMIDEKKGSQATVLKQAYLYIKHAQFDKKANLYVENKQLKKRLRNADQ